jgi:hypothetical protein
MLPWLQKPLVARGLPPIPWYAGCDKVPLFGASLRVP